MQFYLLSVCKTTNFSFDLKAFKKKKFMNVINYEFFV